MKSLPRRQQGVALLVSLVLLLLLTILAITAARTSSLQQRMASNAQEQNSAFQAAESGLSRWINLFEAGSAIPAGTQTNGDGSAYRLDNPPVDIQANCLFGSVGTTGFVFDCYHVTSTATSADGTARARHQIGYLTRTGQ